MIYDDDYDDDMTEAKRLFNEVTEENSKYIENSAIANSIEITKESIGCVSYFACKMKDHSKITFGDNGYVGYSTE